MFKSIKVALFMTYKTIFKGNKGIPVMTVLMLILVFINMLFLPSLIDGLVDRVHSILRSMSSSNIMVEPPQGERFLTDVSNLEDELMEIDGIEAVTSKNILGVEMEYDGYVVTYPVVAVDTESYKEVFDVHEYMIEGEFLDEDDTDQIVLGVQVAGNDDDSLELYTSSLRSVHAGDKVNVQMSNVKEREYTVKGIFDAGFVKTDCISFITEKELFDIMPGKQDSASSLHVKIEDGYLEKDIMDEISNINEDITLKSWEELAGSVESMTVSFTMIASILRIIALLVAAITIFIITYVDLVNKRRQIGIQRAIGITSESILFSYIFGAMFYSVVGAILGSLIFMYVVIPVEHANPLEFPFGPILLISNYQYMVSVLLTLSIVTVLAAIIPTIRTLRVKILDAIWG